MFDTREAIENIPDGFPTYWVVYNEDMIAAAEATIAEVKGPLKKWIDVISHDQLANIDRDHVVYLDPNLYHYLGCGHN